jgi:hypothetical protein
VCGADRAQVLERGYESHVAKDEASVYEGGATRRWLKVKQKDWTVEVDDWRMLAYKDGERVHLVSRNGRDHTRRFRDIAAAISKLSARSLVLDGEVAIYDQQLRSRFDWLREPDPDAIASPSLLPTRMNPKAAMAKTPDVTASQWLSSTYSAHRPRKAGAVPGGLRESPPLTRGGERRSAEEVVVDHLSLA